MSTLRNIATHVWRGSIVRKANVVLGVTGAALTAACAAENVVGPQPQSRQSSAASSRGATFDLGTPAPKPAPAPKPKPGPSVSAAQLDSLQQDFQAYKHAVQSGYAQAEFLVCSPKHAVTVRKVVGPKGLVFNVGPHKFSVPAGALDTNVTITATAPASLNDELQFEPHGLQFNKPVQMTMSYKGCVVPSDAVLGVAYVGHHGNAAASDSSHGATKQRMPAHDDKTTSAVSALTDHFSGYVITWGRN